MTVTSQVAGLPLRHGISETPSGRLPSVLTNPDGSLEAGIPAFVNARQMASFKRLCLAIRPQPSLHDSPCIPLASTNAPQGHSWGTHKFKPRRKPTATLTASLSSLKPQADIGNA